MDAKKIEIVRYEPSMKRMWDEFAAASRQGTFLLQRGYMDYHADRFEDYSLVAMRGGRVCALLPANREGDEMWSHRGLTYGGWLTPVSGFDASVMLDVWDAALDFLRADGAKALHYKAIPWIYARCGAEDDVYGLFRLGAQMETCQISSTVDLQAPLGFDQNSRRNLRKAVAAGLTVEESDNFGAFWDVLGRVLTSRHGVGPVHSLAEMELLASRFPQNIRLFTVKNPKGYVLAGTVIYVCGHVAHAQYIAASDAGCAVGALPMLFSAVMERFAACCRYFDFGISTERGGQLLNAGLLRQKSGFGGRGVCYTSYRLTL